MPQLSRHYPGLSCSLIPPYLGHTRRMLQTLAYSQEQVTLSPTFPTGPPCPTFWQESAPADPLPLCSCCARTLRAPPALYKEAGMATSRVCSAPVLLARAPPGLYHDGQRVWLQRCLGNARAHGRPWPTRAGDLVGKSTGQALPILQPAPRDVEPGPLAAPAFFQPRSWFLFSLYSSREL